jgi:hypothetical protein
LRSNAPPPKRPAPRAPAAGLHTGRPRGPALPRERYALPLPPKNQDQAGKSETALTPAALIDHYTRPRNAGSLDRKDPSVGSGLVGAPACGDVIRLDIRVDEASGTIVDARFKTFGCGSAIASSSYLTTLVKGKRRAFFSRSAGFGAEVDVVESADDDSGGCGQD